MNLPAILSTATASCLLTACSFFNAPLQALPPANAVQPCPPLRQVSGTVTMGDVVRVAVDTANAYHDCQARHQSLVDWATSK